MGIPADWTIVENWLNSTFFPDYEKEEKSFVFSAKNKQLPKLESYTQNPGDNFWKIFPKRELPDKPSTTINIENLEILVRKYSEKMTATERNRAWKVIQDLKNGADSYQEKQLPPLSTQNSQSTYDNGEFLTDKIATWIIEKFVSGPFDYAPLPGFRSNPLIAIARNGKIRPVVNMSGPKGFSFNDNLKRNRLEKVYMTTARQFSYCLKETGKNAIFSKFDLKDAYKLMPAKTQDLRLQGFTWMDKYFCETQQTFGAVPSVSNFDRLGNTIMTLVAVAGNIPRKYLSRTLDDFQGVGPENSDIAKKFATNMREICHLANVPLAELCEKKEKAFELETRGSVLGTGFDSSNMTWFLSKEKVDKIVRRCAEASAASHLSLQQTQKLMGTINDFSQMNRFMKFFKSEGNSLLAKFANNENLLLPVTEKLKKDLLVISNAAVSALHGIPIADRKSFPPLSALTFYSDAAGAKYCWQNGKFTLIREENRGVSILAGENPESIWKWSRMTWPDNFLSAKDEKGVEYGRKSTTLESIALLLPFTLFPESVAGKHVVFYVDNIAVVYGWERGGLKKDSTADSILKTVHVLASFLGTKVYVRHIKRVSNDMSDLADDLTRRLSPVNMHYRRCLEKAKYVPADYEILQEIMSNSKTPMYITMLTKIKNMMT